MKLGNVLIVDDDAICRFLAATVMGLKGAAGEIGFAGNGQEALELLEKKQYDLVLLDLNMPVMDGWDFLEALQENSAAPLPNVVLLTSSPDPSDREKAAQYPAVKGFLTKPFSPQSVEYLLNLLCPAVDLSLNLEVLPTPSESHHLPSIPISADTNKTS